MLRENTNSSNFFLRLYSDNSGEPDSILTSFTPDTPISSTFAVTDFTPDSAVQLAANTTYWLIGGVSANDGGSYQWGFTFSSNETGIDGWTTPNQVAVTFNQEGFGISDPDSGSYQFSVDATDLNAATTPEPTSLLALLGLGGFALGSRFKN